MEPLVKGHVLKHYNYKVPPHMIDDLIQEGFIAYIKAKERFDPEKGYEFEAYAIVCVSGAVKNYIRDKGRLIKTPRKNAEPYTFQSEFLDGAEDEFINPVFAVEDDLSNVWVDSYYSLMTDTERKVVDLTAEGLSQRQIAKLLNISQMSISRHLSRVRRKVGEFLNEIDSNDNFTGNIYTIS